jgi:hypothetical protein
MYAENELLFPPHVIPNLRQARGDAWQELVDRVAGLPDDDPESLAFSLMMVRLNGCLSCETDSFRAMRGCTPCALQVLHRHKGPDGSLLARYRKSQDDVEAYIGRQAARQAMPIPKKTARAA